MCQKNSSPGALQSPARAGPGKSRRAQENSGARAAAAGGRRQVPARFPCACAGGNPGPSPGPCGFPPGFRQVPARSPPGPRQVPARFLPGFRQVPRQVSHLAACQVACQVPCQAPQEPPARCPARFPSDSDHAQLPPSGIGISIWLSINMSIKTITSGPSMWITGMALTTPTFGSYHGSYTFP